MEYPLTSWQSTMARDVEQDSSLLKVVPGPGEEEAPLELEIYLQKHTLRAGKKLQKLFMPKGAK